MLIFLELNGCQLKYSQDELIEIILGIASGKNVANDLLCWIINHSIKLMKKSSKIGRWLSITKIARAIAEEANEKQI